MTKQEKTQIRDYVLEVYRYNVPEHIRFSRDQSVHAIFKTAQGRTEIFVGWSRDLLSQVKEQL